MGDNGKSVAELEAQQQPLSSQRVKKGLYRSSFLANLLSLGVLPLVFLLIKKESSRRHRDKQRFTLNRDHLREIVSERTTISLAHARLAAIVEYSDDAILSKDLSGKILTWNAGAQRMFGYRPEEIIGKSISLILPPERIREEDEILDLLDKGHHVKNYETVRMSKNGWRIDVAVTSSLLKDEKGNVIGVSKIFRDISDKKLIEEILKRDKESLEKMIKEKSDELVAAQMKIEKLARLSDIGVLAATVAHELRNPLAAIGMATCNIRRKAKEEEALKSHLRTIEKKIDESEKIISNLLFYSRLRPPQHEKINLSPFLEECIENAQKQLKKEVEFVKDWDGVRNFLIEADPLQIKEVLSNLLYNAVDAVKEKGIVKLKAIENQEGVEIIVADNGNGISKENLERVFEAFFTTKAKGTGLGLTVCRQVIDMHKGRIEIDSELGKGTSVAIYLPKENK
jgi:PAS domain S-box-containing protein